MKSLSKAIVYILVITGFLSVKAQVVMGTDRTAGAELLFVEDFEAKEAYGERKENAENLDYINLILIDGGVMYNGSKLRDYSSLSTHFIAPKNESSNTRIIIGIEDNAPMEALYWLIAELMEMDKLQSPYGIYFFKKEKN